MKMSLPAGFKMLIKSSAFDEIVLWTTGSALANTNLL